MKYFSIILTIALLGSCSQEGLDGESISSEESNGIKPFNVSLDMTTSEVRELYSDYDFLCAPASNHGLCGDVGFEVLRNDTVVFFFWERWQGSKLDGFVLYEPKQKINDIHVGMNFYDYLEKHPDTKTEIDLITSKETVQISNGNIWFSLDTEENNRVAEYNFDDGEGEFVRFINTDKQIASIYVTNPN